MKKKIIKNILKKLGAGYVVNKLLQIQTYFQKSYSQCGEDLIIYNALSYMNIKNVYYIDIGAHHPFNMSNTAFFYKKGFNGICIEPEPNLYKTIKKYRKRDICLNIGVGVNTQKELDFFIMSASAENTFSQEQAERISKVRNYSIIKKIKIPVMNINEVIEKYAIFKPNFISIDVEGLDFEILKTFDFNKNRPEVFCIETLMLTTDNREEKIEKIINYMIEQNYFVYADTHINTIFVSQDYKIVK